MFLYEDLSLIPIQKLACCYGLKTYICFMLVTPTADSLKNSLPFDPGEMTKINRLIHNFFAQDIKNHIRVQFTLSRKLFGNNLISKTVSF
jgi:hypothetical protein